MDTTFEQFVGARGGGLLRFALMVTGDRGRAEDLVQTVLARAYPHWARIGAMAAPEAYLKTVLVHEHLKWWRRRASREVPVADPTVAGATGDHADAQASRAAGWALLGRLPRRQRAVLALRYYEDMPDDEIAAVLGCAVSTVRSQATRALATLRAVVPSMEKENLP